MVRRLPGTGAGFLSWMMDDMERDAELRLVRGRRGLRPSNRYPLLGSPKQRTMPNMPDAYCFFLYNKRHGDIGRDMHKWHFFGGKKDMRKWQFRWSIPTLYVDASPRRRAWPAHPTNDGALVSVAPPVVAWRQCQEFFFASFRRIVV